MIGTMSQPKARHILTNGDYTVAGGFWCGG